MRVSIKELSKSATHLAGATNGQQHLQQIVERLDTEGEGETVFLDFTGIESATSSYLKAVLFAFFEDAQRRESGALVKPAFPVLVGLSEVVREEVSQLASFAVRQFVEGLKVRGDEVLLAMLYGKLDRALEATLTALVAKGAATATALHAAAGNEPAITAWNNRLADLYAKRLVKRRRAGKQWIYEPIAREFKNG
jgi:hypothetical protein